MIMRRLAALPLSALLVSLLVPQAVASPDATEHRDAVPVPVSVGQADPVYRAKPPKPAMSLAQRREQVAKDVPRLGHQFDLLEAGSPAASKAAIDWSISNERYEPLRKPAITAWGNAYVNFDGPVRSSVWTVDVALVEVATGVETPLPSYSLMCGGFCTSVGIWSDTLAPGLTPGRLYRGRFRVRNSGATSPWLTLSQAQPALFTPGIPGDLAGQCACNAGSQAYRGDPVNTATGAFVESLKELVRRAGYGTPVGSKLRGEAGFKERIDFGKTIGIWVGKDGTQMQTTVGILHYKADGSVHIVPAKPNG
jgi:hypothetical protein